MRGHPDVVLMKVGNYLKDRVPVFTGNTGFRLEFIPMKIGAGMTKRYAAFTLWAGSN